MNISIEKSKLKLIYRKLIELKDYHHEIVSPKPEIDKLFNDFRQIGVALKSHDEEIFLDIDATLQHTLESRVGIRGKGYMIYNKSSLELLLFEVAKAIEFIQIYESGIVPNHNNNPYNSVNLICDRFNIIAKQLRKRHSNRETLNVRDEYDVQDLLHSLLRLYFDDIRTETYVPEYAGGNSRIDFVLKTEGIAIETKMTRQNLKATTLGEELIIDISRYKNHPDVKTLFCFVYDPEGWINNPKGIENDLSGLKDELDVIVRIEPKS